MKITGFLLIVLILGIISCEKDNNPNYSLLLTNENLKVWRLDSISFNEFNDFMVAVDLCSSDDKYTFKINNLLIYDNNGTGFKAIQTPWSGNCLDSIIYSETNWELEDKYLKLGEKTYEIFKISQNQMVLRFPVGNLPQSEKSIPLYKYEVYSYIE